MEKETKRCPYCGEIILAVAQKCKHCGEWLNKDTNSHQSKEDPPKGRIAVKANTDNPMTSSISSKNATVYIVAAIVAVAIVIVLVFQFSGKQKPSTTYESQDNMKETETPVEIQPEYVYPEDNEEVIEIPGMIQHTEEQGKYIPGDDDPWND